MYTKTLIVTTLAGLATAGLIPVFRQAPSAFGIISLRSASPIQFSVINANNNKFFIGEPITSTCPDEPGVVTCPPGNTTALVVNNGAASMDSEVNQEVYAAADGALSYSVAHSGGVVPPGSITGNFTYTPSGQDFVPGTFTLEGVDFYACPGAASVYQIYAGTPGFTETGCLEINIGTFEYSGVAAYQY